MNQLAFSVGAAAGMVLALIAVWALRRLRPARPAWLEQYDETHIAAFEQWPTTALVLDPDSQRIIAANPAALRSLGYTLDELRAKHFSDLFQAEGTEADALVRRVQESSSACPG